MLHLPVLMTQNTGDLHSCRYGETRAHSHRQNTCVGIIQRSQQLKLLYTNIVFNQQNEKGGKKNSRNCFKYKKKYVMRSCIFRTNTHTNTIESFKSVSQLNGRIGIYIRASDVAVFFFLNIFVCCFICSCDARATVRVGGETTRTVQSSIWDIYKDR